MQFTFQGGGLYPCIAFVVTGRDFYIPLIMIAWWLSWLVGIDDLTSILICLAPALISQPGSGSSKLSVRNSS